MQIHSRSSLSAQVSIDSVTSAQSWNLSAIIRLRSSSHRWQVPTSFAKSMNGQNLPSTDILDCSKMFAIVFFVKIPPKKRSRTGNPLLCRQKCVRLTVIPGPGVSRAVFVKIHLKIEYMFLNFARDVTACTWWADLVKCCRHLISLNDLASSARMRSREMCRKSLGHRRRVP